MRNVALEGARTWLREGPVPAAAKPGGAEAVPTLAEGCEKGKKRWDLWWFGVKPFSLLRVEIDAP